MSTIKMPTQFRLHQLLNYNPATGIFTWKSRPASDGYLPSWTARFANTVAGQTVASGYVRIRIDGNTYYAHRLAMVYMYDVIGDEIDHADGNPNNNAIDNLRVCTKSENQCNKRRVMFFKGRQVQWPYKGIFSMKSGRWGARIYKDRICYHLGNHPTAIAASQAYNLAAMRMHGEFARLNEH